VLYEPGDLRDRLAALGWQISITPVGWRFFYLTGSRTENLGRAAAG
jgi:hypothetical protein